MSKNSLSSYELFCPVFLSEGLQFTCTPMVTWVPVHMWSEGVKAESEYDQLSWHHLLILPIPPLEFKGQRWSVDLFLSTSLCLSCLLPLLLFYSKSWNMKVSQSTLLFFQAVSTKLGSLPFHLNFRASLSLITIKFSLQIKNALYILKVFQRCTIVPGHVLVYFIRVIVKCSAYLYC